MKKYYVLDENIASKALLAMDLFIYLKKNIADKTIYLKLVNLIRNPIVFLTKNSKDFRGKLDDHHTLLCVSPRLDDKILSTIIPKCIKKIEDLGSLHNKKILHLGFPSGKSECCLFFDRPGMAPKIISL